MGTLDNITCTECGSMDGKHFKVKDMQEGVTAPPFHTKCRCTTVPYYEDDLSDDFERVARAEDGNNVYVNGKMTYTEWEKKCVANSGESGIIKTITIQHIEKLYGNGVISDDIINEIKENIGENRKYFDNINIVSIPANKDNEIDVFRTNVTPNGNWANVVLEINAEFFKGKTLQKIDEIIQENYRNGHFVSENINDLITHEAGHAKLMYGKSYARCEAITDELEYFHIDGISITAGKNGDECIAECNVLLSKGETIPKEAQDLLNEYMEE